MLKDLAELRAITEPDTPGTTRRFPSPAFLEGRRWLRGRLEAVGLTVSLDAAANMFGRREGSCDLSPIMIGSHTDTVFAGGHLDGALGVLAALEAARRLPPLRHPLLVADFLAEEANDFGISCVGSRSLSGNFDPQWLSRSACGQTLGEAIREAGGEPERIAKGGPFAACLELHIEQGRVLENAGVSLGVVSGIVGITRGTLELIGQANHAGTARMDLRRDALVAAAALVLELERLCLLRVDAIGTVGRLVVSPNQANVVPGKVELTAEVRHLDQSVIDDIWHDFIENAQLLCQSREIGLLQGSVTHTPPAVPPPWLIDKLVQVCRAIDPGVLVLPSGAGHDTGHLGRICPAAMLFVPSVGGRSHCPEEDTAPEHLEKGVQALVAAVLDLDAAG
jgi:N-carbamoyl-L-amino-acid hydrolase